MPTQVAAIFFESLPNLILRRGANILSRISVFVFSLSHFSALIWSSFCQFVFSMIFAAKYANFKRLLGDRGVKRRRSHGSLRV